MKILGSHEASLNCIYHPTYTFPAGWFFVDREAVRVQRAVGHVVNM